MYVYNIYYIYVCLTLQLHPFYESHTCKLISTPKYTNIYTYTHVYKFACPRSINIGIILLHAYADTIHPAHLSMKQTDSPMAPTVC